jgi:hypothetical protein
MDYELITPAACRDNAKRWRDKAQLEYDLWARTEFEKIGANWEQLAEELEIVGRALERAALAARLQNS